MVYLYAITGLGLIISFIANGNKTLMAIRIATQRFTNILPAFGVMLIFVSIALFLLPDEIISAFLVRDNKYISTALASAIGSIAIMPGFIAFPLCGILLTKGVPYMVLSAFTTTLMMVGILSYPVESAYLGIKVTIIRNIISFLIALIVALMTGVFFGELL